MVQRKWIGGMAGFFLLSLTLSCSSYSSGPIHHDYRDEMMNRCLLQLMTTDQSEEQNVFQYCFLPVMLMEE